MGNMATGSIAKRAAIGLKGKSSNKGLKGKRATRQKVKRANGRKGKSDKGLKG
jgi:hypothetical protein